MLIRKLKEWWSSLFAQGDENAFWDRAHMECDFHNDPFFTQHRVKTLRLAEIARERSALKDRLQKAIAQKKARTPIYQALKALRTEEMRIEAGA